MNTAELSALPFIPNTAQAYARLDLAPLSDTGTAVPIALDLKAPSGMAFVAFEIFAPDNPVSSVVKVKLTQPANNYHFETRFRLGISQDVWLVARLADGSLMGDRAPTVLTSSACFDAS